MDTHLQHHQDNDNHHYDFFHHGLILFVLELHINETMQYPILIFICVWLCHYVHEIHSYKYEN